MNTKKKTVKKNLLKTMKKTENMLKWFKREQKSYYDYKKNSDKKKLWYRFNIKAKKMQYIAKTTQG